MEDSPAPAAEALHHRIGGGDGERYQEEEAREAKGDVGAVRDVLEDVVEIEERVEHDVGREVQADVEEREQSEHTAQPYELVPAGDTPQRRHAQGDEQEAQSPFSGLVGDGLDRVRPPA